MPEVPTSQVIAAGERMRALRAIRMASATLQIGGGIACRRSSGSWLNVAVGMGLASPITSGDVERVAHWFAESGREARLEIADRARGLECLFNTGYRLSRIVTILSLNARDYTPANLPFMNGAIVRIEQNDVRAIAACSQILVDAFVRPFRRVTDEDTEVYFDCLKHDESRAFAAIVDGQYAGIGFIDVEGAFACPWGAAVASKYRGAGIQRQLLEARLWHAFQCGATAAFIEAESGGPTHRNAARLGFTMSYSRAVLVRPL